MKHTLFIRYFFIGSLSLLLIILSLNLLVDPYVITHANLLNIKHKLVRDGRVEKINQIKELKAIDNLILGSSRSERLNPATVNRLLGGHTYTFGIGGANVEDALGLLLYLEREHKLPKNVILCLDFSMFGAGKPSDSFYEIPELNFLNSHNKNRNYAAKVFSIDATRASIKTLQTHLKKSALSSNIDQNGFLISREKTPSGDMESIQKLAHQYYMINYRAGEITFSEERFEYLRHIVEITNRHGIKLHVMLTPVHQYLYSMIEENSKLNYKFVHFKQRLAAIAPYYDAMVLNPATIDKYNFEDAVHYNEKMGDYLLSQLLQTR